MSVTVTQQITEQTVVVTGNPVENNVVVTVSNARGPAGAPGASTWDGLTGTASDVPFEPVTPPAHAEGLLFYDSADKSLVYYGDEPDVAMNIGRELWVRVRNDSGAPILNGNVVYINDAIGQLPTIRLARADSAVTSRVIGIATHDIGNNEFGYVTTAGEVKGLNTVAFQDGDLLFLSADTAGDMTTTAPTAPNRVIQVATVLHAHISQGKLYCHPENDSVPSTGIVDSTVTGRALITAADAGAARTTLGLGTTDSVTFGQLTATATSSNQHTLASSAGTNISGPLTLSGSGSDTLAATYSNTITLTGTTGVTIAGGPLVFSLAGGISEQRYSTGLNPQAFRLYNTYSSSTNFERLNFRWDTNVAKIGTEKGSGSPGGTARDLVLETDGTERVRVSAAGVFSVDGVTLGRGAGAIATNTAAGFEALAANTTGINNAVFGYRSMPVNTTGNGNTGIGSACLFKNTTGGSNTAIGLFALFDNVTGSENTALGSRALQSNSGSQNTAVGHQSLISSTTGNNNSAIGINSGRFIADGTTANTVTNNSVYLGSDTKALASGQQNQIVIGHSATGLGTNTAVLGNDSIVTTALKGNVGIGTTSPASKLTVTGGDIEATDATKGVILKAPNGTRYRITVDNAGALTTTAI